MGSLEIWAWKELTGLGLFLTNRGQVPDALIGAEANAGDIGNRFQCLEVPLLFSVTCDGGGPDGSNARERL